MDIRHWILNFLRGYAIPDRKIMYSLFVTLFEAFIDLVVGHIKTSFDGVERINTY